MMHLYTNISVTCGVIKKRFIETNMKMDECQKMATKIIDLLVILNTRYI